jgi:hypothetical protein
LMGDKVKVSLSAYDLSKCRIEYREKWKLRLSLVKNLHDGGFFLFLIYWFLSFLK